MSEEQDTRKAEEMYQDADETVAMPTIAQKAIRQYDSSTEPMADEQHGLASDLQEICDSQDSTIVDGVETTSFAAVDHEQTTSAAGVLNDSGNLQAKKHHGVRNTFIGLVILLVLIAAGLFAVHQYFQGRVAYGVSFGNIQVEGKSASEVETIVKQAVKRSAVTIGDAKGRSVTADFKRLHVQANIAATVDRLLQAKHENVLQLLNWWNHKRVPVVANQNTSALDDFVIHQFIDKDDAALPFTAVFDQQANAYVVKDGAPGRLVDTLPVHEAVKKLLLYPGSTRNVTVGSRRVESPIKRDTAVTVVKELNEWLTKKITLTNGDAKKFVIPPDVIASWIDVKEEISRHKITYELNKNKVFSWLSSQLAKHLNQEKVNQEDAIDKSGRVIFTIVHGVNGVDIQYSQAIAQQVYDALKARSEATVPVPSTISKYDVEKKLTEMRIVVDKTTQTASVYKNDVLVKTFPVCTGKSGEDESVSGTFYIYLRYDVQDMRGFNADGSPYLSRGVRWVSYYNGGEGFHTASWNYHGIATGNPKEYGSHGCINMYEQDARWIFEHCPRGTVVQVVGSQPDGPVRS